MQGSKEAIWLRSQGVESSSFRDEIAGGREMEVGAERRAGAVVGGDPELCRAIARRNEAAGGAEPSAIVSERVTSGRVIDRDRQKTQVSDLFSHTLTDRYQQRGPDLCRD